MSKERSAVEDFVALCQRALKNSREKLGSFRRLVDFRDTIVFPKYKRELHSSFLKHSWMVTLRTSNDTYPPDIDFSLQFSYIGEGFSISESSSDGYNGRGVSSIILTSGEFEEDLIFQLEQAVRDIFAQFDKDFIEAVGDKVPEIIYFEQENRRLKEERISASAKKTKAE